MSNIRPMDGALINADNLTPYDDYRRNLAKNWFFLESRLLVINNTDREIFWCDALGVTVYEKPSHDVKFRRGIYLTYKVSIPENSSCFCDDLFLGVETDPALRAEIQKQLSMPTVGLREVTLQFFIDELELSKSGGHAYLNKFNLVVGFVGSQVRKYHPYSKVGQRYAAVSRHEAERISVDFLYIDNTRKENTLYYNTGFGVIPIVSKVDLQHDPGVFITYTDLIDPSIDGVKLVVYTPEQLTEDNGFYTTEAAAAAYGTPKLLNERTLLSAKREFEEYKLAKERESTELKAKLAEQEAEFKRKEQEYKREESEYKRREQQEKWEYDSRKRDRDDKSDEFKAALDILKTVGAIAAAVVSIIAIMKTQKK